MFEPTRGETYSLDQEDIIFVRTESGATVIVPRSVRNASSEAQETLSATALKAEQINAALGDLEDLVAACRANGLSWDAVGWAVGTTGSAARKRWGGVE